MKKILYLFAIILFTLGCNEDDNEQVVDQNPENFVNGIVDIPENYTNSQIQVLSNGGKYDVAEDGSFNIPPSDVIYAINKSTNDIIYFTYISSNVSNRDSNGGFNSDYVLNAEETAISYGITFSLPVSYIPSSANYSTKITELKQLIRDLPSFQSLVNVIEEEVSNPAQDLVIHLKDELLQLWTDARECGGEFFDGLNTTENPLGLSDEELSEINNGFPYFRYKSSQNGTIKLEHTNSTFNNTTNKWDLDITLFNETPLYLGAVVGQKTGNEYTYDAENVENILAPYNTSELLKDFTDCNAYGEYLSGLQHLYTGDISSITLFATQKDLTISVDEYNRHLVVFSPQNSTRLSLYTLLQGIIKQSSVFTKVFYSKISENDDLKTKKEKLLEKLVNKAIQDDDVIQGLLVLSNDATLENYKNLSLTLWDVLQEFMTEKLFTDVILNAITEQMFPYDEYNDLPNTFLAAYKLHKKIVSATADQIDIGLLFWGWQNYNGGVAFECVLPNSNTVPTVTTTSISNIIQTTATSGGNVTDDGGSEVTAKGVCWSTSPNPTTANDTTNDGTGQGSFTSSLTGLTANTTYYVRAYATNSEGTSYGGEIEFTTTSDIPIIITTDISSITENTATSGGNVTSEGSSSVTEKGVCWSTNPNPTIADNITNDGTGIGIYTSLLEDLAPGSNYYVRAYAINSVGTAYGNEIEFSSDINIETSSFTDARDGKTYNTVKIGNQWWFAENLAYNSSGSSVYNDVSDNEAVYGRLYSKNESLTVCPNGWLLPSRSDYLILSNYLNGTTVSYFTAQGGKLKETGTSHWNSPNTGANNISGFTALPGGVKSYNGNYSSLGEKAFFWTRSSDGSSSMRTYIDLSFDSDGIHTAATSYHTSMSCRCIKE